MIKRFQAISGEPKTVLRFVRAFIKGCGVFFQENLKRLLVIHQEWGVWFTDLHYLSAVPVGVVVYR